MEFIQQISIGQINDPNMVAFVVEAETGSWGIGAEPTGEAMKAFFDLMPHMDETWVDKEFYGGEGGIRTHERVSPLLVFKTSAFNRSATSPLKKSIY